MSILEGDILHPSEEFLEKHGRLRCWWSDRDYIVTLNKRGELGITADDGDWYDIPALEGNGYIGKYQEPDLVSHITHKNLENI